MGVVYPAEEECNTPSTNNFEIYIMTSSCKLMGVELYSFHVMFTIVCQLG